MTNQEFLESITQEGEEWRDVIGYEGLYAVSSFGRVVSLWRTANNRFQDVPKPPRLMNVSRGGAVILSKEDNPTKFRIHLLVARHFLPEPNNGETILDFRDGDRTNSRASNLYWRKIKSRKKQFDVSDLDGEIWEPIDGYENLYYISSHGRIKSLRYNKILAPFKGSKIGYYYICLVKDGVKTKTTIHRLVATHFCDNPHNYTEVEHLDSNPLNNHYSNLRWCNHTMNMNNEITRKRASDALIGSINNPTSKAVVQLRNGTVLATYPSMAEAERQGFSQAEISRCCQGKRKSHYGYEWMFLSDYEASNQ